MFFYLPLHVLRRASPCWRRPCRSATPTSLTIAAVVLAFDLVIGLATFFRIAGANEDDLRALHGMARVRDETAQMAWIVTPYFTSATHDDRATSC